MISKCVRTIYQLNRKVGEWVSWLTFLMIVVTFLVVLLRYGFNLGWVWLQKIVSYAHAIVFLSLAAFALQKQEHVRVDIFYQKWSPKRKAIADLFGIFFFLFPFLGMIFYQSFSYVIDSWKVLEGSKDGGGIELVFVLKSFILIFCVLLFLEGLAMTVENIHSLWTGHFKKTGELHDRVV